MVNSKLLHHLMPF